MNGTPEHTLHDSKRTEEAHRRALETALHMRHRSASTIALPKHLLHQR
jgi:hypothetical protein